jgi:hypothetical protein
MLLKKQLFVGNKKLCNIENNSSTNLLEQPCMVHMFININVVASLLHCAPQNKAKVK